MLKTLTFITVLIVFTVLAFLVGKHLQFGGKIQIIEPADFQITYADFIVIMLTAIAILLTILGIGIAILSFYGFKNVQSYAASSASDAALEQINDPESTISKRIMKVAEGSAYEGIESIRVKNNKNKNAED